MASDACSHAHAETKELRGKVEIDNWSESITTRDTLTRWHTMGFCGREYRTGLQEDMTEGGRGGGGRYFHCVVLDVCACDNVKGRDRKRLGREGWETDCEDEDESTNIALVMN